jgi:hypothetical protein
MSLRLSLHFTYLLPMFSRQACRLRDKRAEVRTGTRTLVGPGANFTHSYTANVVWQNPE